MSRKHKKIPGMTKELASAVSDIVLGSFKNGNAPSRAYVMEQLRREYPKLTHPRVEVTIALCLNDMVDCGIFERHDGKFYAPSKKYLEELKGETQ